MTDEKIARPSHHIDEIVARIDRALGDDGSSDQPPRGDRP